MPSVDAVYGNSTRSNAFSNITRHAHTPTNVHAYVQFRIAWGYFMATWSSSLWVLIATWQALQWRYA